MGKNKHPQHRMKFREKAKEKITNINVKFVKIQLGKEKIHIVTFSSFWSVKVSLTIHSHKSDNNSISLLFSFFTPKKHCCSSTWCIFLLRQENTATGKIQTQTADNQLIKIKEEDIGFKRKQIFRTRLFIRLAERLHRDTIVVLCYRHTLHAEKCTSPQGQTQE